MFMLLLAGAETFKKKNLKYSSCILKYSEIIHICVSFVFNPQIPR